MQNSNKLPVWVWVCVLLAAVASLYSISLRHRVEAKNKAVAPALEYQVIADAASSSGVTEVEGLQALKLQGLRAVILPERTLADSFRLKDISLSNRRQLKSIIGAEKTIRDVEVGLQKRGIRFIPDEAADFAPGYDGILVSASPELLDTVSVGLDPTAAKEIQDAGLVLIARNSNVPSPSLEYVNSVIKEAADKGAKGFLPQGDSVLGNRALIKETMEALKANGMFYCSPEFAKLSGETNMTIAGPDNTVRLHSIQAAEIERMSPSEVVERFARAYSERNQRILLIRPFEDGGGNPLESLKLSLAKINRAIVKEGGAVGTPRPWADPNVPAWVLPIIALAVLGTYFVVLTDMMADPRWRYFLFAGMALICVPAILKRDATYLATFAAMVFPVLAYLNLRQMTRVHPVGQFLIMSAISLVGGLCVAGLLNGPAFYVRADTFWAVKLAHFLPIVIVAALVVRDQLDLKKVALTPITWGALGVSAVVLFALGFMLARTGNDNPAAVSGIELQLRSVLEKFFSTRPRTKEFMFGHPAMLVGLFALAASARLTETKQSHVRAVSGFLVALGMIGQTSVVNTMCHLHTPVQVGLVRIAIGLIVGLIFGLVAWAVVKRWVPQEVSA